MPCCCLSHTERSSRTHATLAPAQTLAFIVSATLGIFLQVMDPKAAPALRAPAPQEFLFFVLKNRDRVKIWLYRPWLAKPVSP